MVRKKKCDLRLEVKDFSKPFNIPVELIKNIYAGFLLFFIFAEATIKVLSAVVFFLNFIFILLWSSFEKN